MTYDTWKTTNPADEHLGPRPMTKSPIIVVGFAYDPATRDWTQFVRYEAHSRTAAIRWMNFNRNLMKNLHILD